MFFRGKEDNWYEQKLLPEVEADLNKFLEQKALDYKVVVAVFKAHAAKIIRRYQDELKQSAGVLPDYMIAIDMGLEISAWTLVCAGKDYIIQKYFKNKKRAEFTGEVKAVIDVAKRNVPEESDGHKRLLQVNCEAERDYMLLIQRYIDFFIINKDYQNGYSLKMIDYALKFPPVISIIERKVKTTTALIQKFNERPLDAKNREVCSLTNSGKM
jgi:hypothetical protein